MLEHVVATKATGDLPFVDPKTYARALREGRIGGGPNESNESLTDTAPVSRS